MELKMGYKCTDIGVIPEDWSVRLLPEICRFRPGKAHERHIAEYGRFVCVNSKFISTDGTVRKYATANFCPASTDDVLMVMSDLPNGRALAKAYLVEQDDLYAVNQRVCALTAYKDSPKYLFYVLNRNPYFLSFDNGVSQTHLLNHVFRKCALPIPPTLAEQESIASALGDVDALIAALDQLIAKKRQLKQAAMQQLLTGQRRLPGYNGEWRAVTLFDLADRKKVHFDDGDWVESEHLAATGVRLIQTGNIGCGEFLDKDVKKYISPESFSLLGCKQLEVGDVLICRLAEPAGRACLLPPLADARIITSVDVTIFRPSEHLADRRFLVQQLCTPAWFAKVNELCGGSTRTRIARGQLARICVSLPQLAEQRAIAEVLSDMDAEISSIEDRLCKTRAIKQGMMQELLTGRIRLIKGDKP
jgi:type I restriction enzyme S subunit